jgi:hypothetical protein
MPEPFVAVIMPLGSTGASPLPGHGLPSGPLYPSTGFPPNLPGHALPGGPWLHPSQGPIYGGGYPAHGLPLPPPGLPGSPEHPVAPLPGAPEQPVAGQGPFYVVIPGIGIVGPLYVPPPSGEAAPKG